MSWDPTLNTGIDVVDYQHMQLVQNAEVFIEACNNNASMERINKILNFLEDYTLQHFATEEKLQCDCDYPGYRVHKKCHDYFIQDFIDFKNRIDEQGESTEIMLELSAFLVDWVLNHIAQEDLKFAAHYKTVHPDLELTGC